MEPCVAGHPPHSSRHVRSIFGTFPDVVATRVRTSLGPGRLHSLKVDALSDHDLFLVASVAAAVAALFLVCVVRVFRVSDPVRLLHARKTIPIRRRRATKPNAESEEVPLHVLLAEECPSLADPANNRNIFRPTWYLFNGHLQTIYAALFAERSARKVNYHRELLYFPDGGNVALDWHAAGLPSQSPSGGSAPIAPSNSDDTTPILVISHGLTGGSHESYVRGLVYESARRGYRSVVVNFRGCADSELTSMQLYCGAYTKDLKTAVAFIKRRYPSAPLMAVGYSLGSNILTKLVGEYGEACPFIGAVSVSNPFDLLGGNRSLNRSWIGRNIYSKTLTQNLIRMYKKHAHIFAESTVVNGAKVLSSRFLYEFDDAFTSKLFGFRTVHEYYRMASSAQYVPDIKVPFLIFTALDDPIVEPEVLPTFETLANPHVVMAATRHGGHIGWYTGTLNPEQWINNPIGEFIGAVFEAHKSLSPEEQLARLSAAKLDSPSPIAPAVTNIAQHPSPSLESVRGNGIERDLSVSTTPTLTRGPAAAAGSSSAPAAVSKPLSRRTSVDLGTLRKLEGTNPVLVAILRMLPKSRLLVLLLGAMVGFIGRRAR
ncbi:hypothetical protein HDU86_005911 [Geranomyces michiganensis]|nr:hypothetical protein HDU86_005911 [Geranomyces michiganensis]